MSSPTLEGFSTTAEQGGLHLVKEGYGESLKALGLLGPEGRNGAGRGGDFAGGRGCPQVVDLPGRPGERAVIRTYHHGGILRGLLRTLFTDRRRAWRELVLMERLRRWGVPTLKGLAALAHRVLPGLYSLQLVTLEEAGASDLLTFLASSPTPRQRRRILEEAGRAVRTMHDHNVAHADLHPRNILVTAGPEPRVLIIDLDQSREEPGLSRDARIASLARMERFLQKSAHKEGLMLGTTDRLRFARGYFGRSDGESRREIRLVASRVARCLPCHRLIWRLESLFTARRKPA